jgi:TPR repeat protein
MTLAKTNAAILLALCAACAPGAAAEKLRSEAPTANDAIGDDDAPACGDRPVYGEPLVVDLPSAARLDLEVAMKAGVPVVRYDCGKLELVKGCRLDGGFEYAGVSLKEDVVVLRNRDEVRANLPISGATIAASLDRGTSLQLAVAMIGKQSTTVQEATQAELEGSCDGATHFVRAALVGAFAMQRASDASVKAAAEIFGAGLSAATSADRDATMRDGKVDDCRSAAPEASSPPGQCASSIRLELVPIAEARRAAKEVAPAWSDPCPSGYRLTAGKCTQTPEEAYVCAPSDKAECKRECDKGNAESCFHAAMPDPQVAPSERPSMADVRALLDKACSGGSARGCTGLGMLVELTDKDKQAAAALLDRGCEGGDVEGCLQLGDRLAQRTSSREWPRDDAKATQLYQRACDLGREDGCFIVASRYFKGLGTPKNVARGKSVLRRGCDGGNAKRCAELGMLMLGLLGEDKELAGVEDVPAGLELLDRSCTKMGSEGACLMLAHMYATGTKVTADKARARDYHGRVCPSQQEAAGCERVGKLLK